MNLKNSDRQHISQYDFVFRRNLSSLKERQSASLGESETVEKAAEKLREAEIT